MTRKRTRWLVMAAVAAAVYGVGNLFQPTVVLGESMAPTLKSGRIIWVDRLYYKTHKPQRGEVVVFQLGGETYIKRVYREPGEVLHYLSLAGEWLGAVRENRVEDMKRRYANLRTSVRVSSMEIPEDCVFVLGDNMLNSEDSRMLGPIPLDCIVGRARLDVDPTKALAYEHVPYRSRPVADRPARPTPQKARQATTPEPEQKVPGDVKPDKAHPHHLASAS